VGIVLPPVAQCPYDIWEGNPEFPIFGKLFEEGLRITTIVQIVLHPVAEFADDILVRHLI
jgi:hypothetical protein